LERGTVFTWLVKQQLDGFLLKTLSSAASVKSADEFNCGNKDEKRNQAGIGVDKTGGRPGGDYCQAGFAQGIVGLSERVGCRVRSFPRHAHNRGTPHCGN